MNRTKYSVSAVLWGEVDLVDHYPHIVQCGQYVLMNVGAW